jgi:hypothetical protein
MTGEDTMDTCRPRLAGELAAENVVEIANPDGCARCYSHLGGYRRARPAGEVFLTAGSVAAELSVAVADISTVVANSLPVCIVRRLSPPVIDWVSRNKGVPLDFCYHGNTWTRPEINDLIQKLRPV